MSEHDALARHLHERFAAPWVDGWDDLDQEQHRETEAWDTASAILASDWLAEHDRAIAETAWAQGFGDGLSSDLSPEEWPANPYRREDQA